MNYYLDLFRKDRFIRVSPIFRIITVFDSLTYHRNDYEVLSAPQRNHIGKILINNEHKRVTGNSFKNINSNENLKFITTKTLGVSPLYELQIQYNENDIFIVTPGTYFLFLIEQLHNSQDEAILDEILNLISIHPVNLEQLTHLSRHDKFYDFLKQRGSEFKTLQQEAINNELKGKKSLGSIF